MLTQLPVLGSFRGYRAAWLRPDFTAGLAVAAVAIPSAIAYPAIAGLPAEVGIYSSILPLIGYALFGPSKKLMVGPDAATMTVLAAVLATMPLATSADRVVAASGIRNPTTRDFIKFSRRARPNKPFIGGPKEVADGLEEWFATRACDGFVVAASHVPGAYEDFSRLVVPELQRRGLFHSDYTGATLRENLGLDRPAVGAWR